MKKIVFETYKLKHSDTGLYHFTKELAQSLVATCPDGWEVEFFGRKQDKSLLPPTAKFRCIRWWHRLYLRAGRDVAVWHSPYQGSPYIPNKAKLVLTVHDLNFLYEKTGTKRNKYLSAIKKETNRATQIVAISQFSADDLASHTAIDRAQIKVILNGCNIYKGEIKEPSQKPIDPFLFGIGTILPKKNWHVLPQLLLDNDLKLYIAGRSSAYSQKIMDEAKKLGVDGRVELLGPVDEAEKHWYLSNCKAFVFPSVAEGFGLPVVEAMYYGKPVFISPHTSLQEVGGAIAYYFPADFNAEGMRQTLRDGLADFAEHGNAQLEREYALSFSWEKAAHKYWNIYTNIK